MASKRNGDYRQRDEYHSRRDDPKDHWRLDKSVPLTLVALFLGQTFGIIWYASAANQRLYDLETKTAALALNAAPVDSRLARVEEKIGFLQTGIDDIKRLVTPTITTGTPVPRARSTN